MVASVKDPTVRVGLDPSRYEAGADRLTLAQQRILRAQETADRKNRSMIAAENAAYREQEQRVADAAAKVEAAEDAKQEAFTETGQIVGVASGVIAAGLAYAANAAIEWEAAWASVTKSVQATPAELTAVEDGLRGLARQLPLTHDEIAEVAASAGQLGVATPKIVSFTKTMIDLGTTTNLTADDAATAIAQLANVMDRSMLSAGDGVERTGATLLALGNAGASTEADILDMATRISGAGKTVGMSVADVLALSSALSSMGIEAELGGGTVTRMLTAIYSAVRSGSPVLRQYAETAGMTVEQFRSLWLTSPVKAIDAFTSGLHDLDAAGGNVVATLDSVKISGSRDVQVMLQMANATGLLSDSVDIASQAWSDNNALVEAANKRYDTTAAKIQVAKNNIKDAGISIGNEVLPVVAKAADAVAVIASGLGSLPQPVLEVAAVLGTVVVAAGLVTSAVMLMIPKVQESIAVFRVLRIEAPATAARLQTVAGAMTRVGGTAAAVLLAATATGMLVDKLTSGDVVQGANAVQAAVDRLAASGDVADLNAQFDDFGKFLGIARSDVHGLDDALKEVTASDITTKMTNALEWLPGVSTRIEIVEARFKQLDQTLAQMVTSGNTEQAARAYSAIAQRAAALEIPVDKLTELFPEYTDALVGVDNAQQNADTSTSNLSQHLNLATGAVEELTEAEQKYRDEIAESDASMVSLSQAYDDAVQGRKEHAQAQADAANDAASDAEAAARKQGKTLEIARKDWEDFYDGRTVSVKEYLTTLQAQVDQQTRWEQNLLTLSSRGVSTDTLDSLRQMGAQGAPLVDQLAKASDKQLDKLDDLYQQAGSSASSEFADQLVAGTPVLEAAGDKLGQAAVDSIVRKLVAGKTTLQGIVDEYGLIVEGFRTPAEVLDPGKSTSKRLDATGKAQTRASATASAAASTAARLDAVGAAQAARALPASGGSGSSVIVVPMSSKTEVPVQQTFSGPIVFTDPTAASAFGKKRALNTIGG